MKSLLARHKEVMIGFHEKLLIVGQGTGQAAPVLPEPRQGDIGQDAPVFPWPSPPALCSPDFVSQVISLRDLGYSLALSWPFNS